MATEDSGGNKVIGRTMWDVIAGLLANKFVLGMLVVVLVAALALIVTGRATIQYTEAGWRLCFPNCESPVKREESPIAQQAPAVVTRQQASSDTSESLVTQQAPPPPAQKPVLSDILVVPVYTKIGDVGKLVPDASIEDNRISYVQPLFGYDAKIIENLADGVTRDATFVINATGEHLCMGDNFTNLLNDVAKSFGKIKKIRQKEAGGAADLNEQFLFSGSRGSLILTSKIKFDDDPTQSKCEWTGQFHAK
ncbi:hypothetical protein LMG27952_04907 [Paraburkholderia hiiakae]|uniref:Uncharacterized protein n=1 Tax=Paraburkholderia hiiakae TaxID=1081782 RepID=A0ABN7I2H9_9BURK|nr:hypothetical protein [Paraburkholderia hiiakae]CAD6549762.1 hypothetical protein LMG27952_04907 [Paraburkholderia hiiakae]